MTTSPCQSCEMGPGAYACHDCGAACCRSCATEIDANLYCGWCAVSVTVAGRPR
jgi:hypothetical protein